MSRKVRIATVAQLGRGGPTPEDNRRRMRRLLQQAVAEKPDIVCLPETFCGLNVDTTDSAEVAEPVPGPTTTMAAELAREHGCYVICPLVARHGERITNDAVLIDRQGAIQGAYSKIHPVVTGSEYRWLERGVTPGPVDVPTFDTDFGRIGIQICFDINWPEPWAALQAKGAEIVFWASAYDGGKHLSVHAWNNHYYVVSAVQSTYARVIDVMGDVLAETGHHDPIVARTIDLDVGLFHLDFNKTQIPLIRQRYGPDVTLRIWHQEALFTLESNRPDLSVADLVAEFKLDPLDEYLARNERLQDAWRQGAPVPDLTPAYVGREQYPAT